MAKKEALARAAIVAYPCRLAAGRTALEEQCKASLIDITPPLLAARLVSNAGNGMLGHGSAPGSSQIAQRTLQGPQPTQARLAGSRQPSGSGSNSPFRGSQGGGGGGGGDNASEAYEDDEEEEHYQRQLQNSYDDEEVSPGGGCKGGVAKAPSWLTPSLSPSPCAYRSIQANANRQQSRSRLNKRLQHPGRLA